MANTYSKLYAHFVFTPSLRSPLITPVIKDVLEKYMTGIVQQLGQKMLAIYCNKDHCHMLVGLTTTMSSENLMREVKSNSSRFLNQNYFRDSNFCWQRGYGSFSVSESEVGSVINYIRNQAEHHKTKSFKEEYLDILKKNDVKYNDDYLFDFFG